MKFEIGILPFHKKDYAIPSITILLDKQYIMSSELLTNHSSGICTFIFEYSCSNNAQHYLEIIADNISSDAGDNHGFSVVSIIIDDVDTSYFLRNGTVYTPIYDTSYIKNYIKPNNLIHELMMIDTNVFQVSSGEYVNYVNSTNGVYKFTFETPLYKWLYDIQFGYMWNRYKVKDHVYNDLNI